MKTSQRKSGGASVDLHSQKNAQRYAYKNQQHKWCQHGGSQNEN